MSSCTINGCSGKLDQKLLNRQIEKYGYFVVSVLPTENNPAFAYTIGNRLIGLPDIFVSGNMSKDVQYSLLANALDTMKDNPDRIIGLKNDIANVPMILYPCDEEKENFLNERVMQAEHFYNLNEDRLDISSKPFSYVQLVWSDFNSNFPSEENKEMQELWFDIEGMEKYVPTLH